MKFRKYNFPHPISGRGSDFKQNCKPTIAKEVKIDEQKRTRNYSFLVEPQSPLIQEYLDLQQAKLVCEVTCSYTLYRKLFEADVKDPNSLSFVVPIDCLRNKVEIKCLIVANLPISGYKNPDFNPIFSGAGFDLEAGDVLAICDNFTEYIDTTGIGVSDFLKLIESDDLKTLEYDLNKDYLAIKLPTDQVDHIRSFIKNPDLKDLLISSIVVPALQYALNHLSEEDENAYGQKKWFEVLKLISEKYGFTEYPERDEHMALIQEILKDPNPRMIQSMLNINNRLTEAI